MSNLICITCLDWSKLTGIVVTLIGVITFIYAIIKYRGVSDIEKKIRELESEFDLVPQKNKNPYMNNAQLMNKISIDQKPIRRKIDLLKQERQFILDKIPLLNFFKK